MTGPAGRHPGLDSGSMTTRFRMIRKGLRSWIPAFAGMTIVFAASAAAQTIAITGGTVALGDGSEPIPNGMVVIRDGRVVAAGDIRMKLPADTQVIDATGKWVTPGIVAGFSRLGLADVDLSAEGADDTTANGPFSASLDASTAINPLDTTVAVNRADGVTRAIVVPQAGKSIFGGQGAVIDTGADMSAVTAARKFQFVELGERGADKAGGSRASAHVFFRNALREAAELRRYAAPIAASRGGTPSEIDRLIVRNPNESRL